MEFKNKYSDVIICDGHASYAYVFDGMEDSQNDIKDVSTLTTWYKLEDKTGNLVNMLLDYRGVKVEAYVNKFGMNWADKDTMVDYPLDDDWSVRHWDFTVNKMYHQRNGDLKTFKVQLKDALTRILSELPNIVTY